MEYIDIKDTLARSHVDEDGSKLARGLREQQLPRIELLSSLDVALSSCSFLASSVEISRR